MLRTQISLTPEDRRLLDDEAARTGRSISALIRDAVGSVYGRERSVSEDLAALRGSFGAWDERADDTADWVARRRSAARLGGARE